ncbi:hypothetical protein GMST_26110 [Geomonas silvestris]|uniref:Uncharacterized protein n=1 Tax=Geomonas silvestris TaxID=2740184 RepID=A0A6V8MJZ6_9BACT|nr:hypothetical protein [Geomonas silvestris]GFO60286.1 hypothetical protein GMST_26110 [Geomonas silvestris]
MTKHTEEPAGNRRGGAELPRELTRAKAPPTPGEMAELHRKVVDSELKAEDTAEYLELERY